VFSFTAPGCLGGFMFSNVWAMVLIITLHDSLLKGGPRLHEVAFLYSPVKLRSMLDMCSTHPVQKLNTSGPPYACGSVHAVYRGVPCFVCLMLQCYWPRPLNRCFWERRCVLMEIQELTVLKLLIRNALFFPLLAQNSNLQRGLVQQKYRSPLHKSMASLGHGHPHILWG